MNAVVPIALFVVAVTGMLVTAIRTSTGKMTYGNMWRLWLSFTGLGMGVFLSYAADSRSLIAIVGVAIWGILVGMSVGGAIFYPRVSA